MERLVDELVKHFGKEPITARDIADRLLQPATAADLIETLQDALIRIAETAERDEFDQTLWGKPPTSEEMAAARRHGEEAVDTALRQALDDALTREQAAELLGVTPQTVSKRLAAGRLVSLQRGRTHRLPAWQFHEGQALPGLAELIEHYPGTPLSLTVWATSPNPDLGGITPAEALTRRNGVAEVITAARAVIAAAW
jgi:excisionase family DNA binding protein